MRRSVGGLLTIVAGVFVVSTAVAAANRDRLVDPLPPATGGHVTDAAAEDPEGPGRGENPPAESVRTERLEELEQAAQAQDAMRLDSLYRAAAEGRGPAMPEGFALTRAMEGLSAPRLDGMLLLWTDERHEDGLGYEFMSFGDQQGYITFSWQFLSGRSDPQTALVSEHARVEYLGDLDVVIDERDLVGAVARMVRVYDGVKTLEVGAVNVDGIDIEEVKDMALTVFARLPNG